jgi:hypothetical protein
MQWGSNPTDPDTIRGEGWNAHRRESVEPTGNGGRVGRPGLVKEPKK